MDPEEGWRCPERTPRERTVARSEAVGSGAWLSAGRGGNHCLATQAAQQGDLLSPNPWMPLVTAVDRKIGWHRLPWPLGLPLVFALMGQLRRENLIDPSTVTPSLPRPVPTPPVNYRTARTADGSFNDLSYPEMGSAGTRFGRNVELARTFREPDAALSHPTRAPSAENS